ncbi:Ms4533A family Cys-rich leader peptide [Streptomyces goshikiensis]
MSHRHTTFASAAIERALLGVTAHSVSDVLCR